MKQLNSYSLLTDLYQLTMMQAYFEDNRENNTAAFDYFFRKIPFDGGYVVFAGLGELLEKLTELQFQNKELNYLKSIGFKEAFLEYLKNFSFEGDVFSVDEGSIVFPNEPVLSVRGNLIECQFIETLLLNTLNFNSLIATKASRMRLAAGKKILGDFGLRRSQGLGGIQASRASVIGGFDSTSNVLAAYAFDLKPVGTMAHSYIQSYDDELTAFRKYAESFPDKSTLLVDTYDTLNSGIPNAIKVAKELEEKGHKLVGIRLDSGDLISLAKKSREMLDDAGLNYVKIVASNQLDEFTIQKIKEENAPIDIFGVGTNLITGQPDAALDGVYKLAMINNSPTLKLSETEEKVTLPGLKQIVRTNDKENNYSGDVIIMESENSVGKFYNMDGTEVQSKYEIFSSQKMLKKVMEDGNRVIEIESAEILREKVKNNLSRLPDEYKSLQNPGTYPVKISKQLLETREKIRAEKTKSKKGN